MFFRIKRSVMLNLFLRTKIIHKLFNFKGVHESLRYVASPSFVGFTMTSLRGGTCLSGEAGDEAIYSTYHS